jgi:hypothetical protein
MDIIPITPPARLHVQPWPDPVIEALGHDPRSTYVEQYWLPILGPSATWLLRRFAAGFDRQPEGFDVPTVDLALSLGLGDRLTRNGLLARSITRIVTFDMARWVDEGTLGVLRSLPPLCRRQLRRLPESLQVAFAEEATVAGRR